MVHTTGAYLFHTDCMLRDLEKDCRTLHEGFAACTKHNQVLEEEVHRVTKIAHGASKTQSKLAKKLNEETTQRLTVEIKLARAETELPKLRAHQIKMKCKEEAYLAAMELVQN